MTQKYQFQLLPCCNVDSDLQFLSAQISKSVGQGHVHSFFCSFTRGGTSVREEMTSTPQSFTSECYSLLVSNLSQHNEHECPRFFPRIRQEMVTVTKYILLHSFHLQCRAICFSLLGPLLLLGVLEPDGQNMLQKNYIRREMNQKLPLQ